jgi:DNA/RNA endonuclease G (NUC1)
MRPSSARALAVCALLSLFAAVGLSRIVPPIFALTNGGSITALGVPLTENFDSLASAGTNIAWADNSTIPGWYSTRATYNSGTGSSNTGALYSFGVAGTNPVTDRALGSVASGGTGTVYQATRLTNNTGATIASLDISYVGEQWRNGGNATAHTLTFQYQVANAGAVTGANAPTTGWTTFAPLSFTGPIAAATAATLDGNAPANRIPKSATLSVTVNPGQEIWLRWQDPDDTGNDHGLAIDDFSVSATGAGDSAPTVTTTTPAAGATNVPLDSNIVVNFSESVTAAPAAFTVQCPAGTPQVFAVSASPATSFTLDPASDLPAGTICSVKVSAGLITDTDTADPPDNMAADFTFTFTTVPPETAPSVVSTTPANSASGVPVNSAIVINFSESVNASVSAFDLECPTGAPQSFTRSATPASSFTLTPTAPLPSATTCTVTVAGTQITDVDANDPPDTMASDFSVSFATANPPPPGAANVIINEVDADTPGSDTAEFVELYDGGVGNTPLDGLVLVFYDGNGHLSYASFDLDGYTTDANGYFTLGNPGVPGVNLVFDPGAFGLLQNGPDAVALYVGNAADFPNGTSVTTANLQDAVVYDTDDADDPVLLALLNADQPQVNENAGGSGTTQSSQRCPNGSGGARNTSTYAQGAPTPGVANSCPAPPPPHNSAIVISQLYGGGGNAGATYQRDFVELFNRGTAAVDIGGWSLQYASASGSGWDFSKQPLGGTIAPGQYYLIALASGGAPGAALPDANISGQINMSGTTGKVALVDSFDGLVGNCPTANPHVMDLVGYGSSADCREGTTTAPGTSNTTSLFRLGGGSIDTNQNGSDFVTGAPSPRRTAPIVELGPVVLSTDPAANGVNAPRDATIQVTFTEPVDVVGAWFDITCAGSGQHSSATFAGEGQSHYITPNINFTAGELCTVTIFKDQVHDQDLDDSGPNTDTLPANYVWSFRVSTGTPPPFPSSVHLTMGNPSGAVASIGQPDNYLMEKAEYALSYDRALGRPNWVSWHLSTEWIGSLTRVDSFRPDPEVPADWYRVQSFDFAGTGFDRGHMTPNADRDKETSIPINQATFLMSNMVAQAPDNNQGPWAALENDLRALLPANEIYIVAGPAGTGGTGSNGGMTTTLAGGHVTVPAWTWKAALVIPAGGGDDISRVSCSTRTIAVIMPNTQGIRNTPWQTFLTTVDAVEALSGYDLFSNLPEPIQRCVEAGVNGSNPPLVKGSQTITFAPPADHTYGDPAFTVSATGGLSGNAVTFTASGACTSGGANGATITLVSAGTCIVTASQAGGELYDAATDVARSFAVLKAVPTVSVGGYSGVYDGAAHGATGTASGVNGEDLTGLLSLGASFTNAPGGTAHWTFPGNGNYSDKSGDVAITITQATATVTVADYTGIYDGQPHGATGTATGITGENLTSLLTFDATFTNTPGGTVTWTFAGNENYPPSSGTATITITRKALTVVANNKTRSHTAPTPALDGTITGVVAGDGITASYSTPPTNVPGSYPITAALNDPNGRLGNYGVSITNGTMVVTNGAPVAVADGPYTGQWNVPLVIAPAGVLANDTDVDGDPLTATVVTGPAHGTLALGANGGFIYTPAANFSGADAFTYKANDGFADGASATASLVVTSPCSNGDCRAGTPIARDDLYTTGQGDTLTVTTRNDVLENDGRFAASALLVSGPAHGTLALNANGSFVYVPATAFYGIDSFVYAARSASGVVGPVATVRLVVRKNLAPDADNDFYAVKTNATLTVAAAGVLKNDSDSDGDALTAALATGPSHGTLILSTNGAFVYKPAANFTGTDTFTYQAVDPFGHADTATVSIRVSRNGTDDDDHHGDESHHHVGDGCDHEQGRNGHFRGDGCEHDRRW